MPKCCLLIFRKGSGRFRLYEMKETIWVSTCTITAGRKLVSSAYFAAPVCFLWLSSFFSLIFPTVL